jgi:hypothetical protein
MTREDVALVVLPCVACHRRLDRLTGVVLLEGGDRSGVERDRPPPLVRLRFGDRRHVVDEDERAVDLQPAVVEIEVRPLEAEHFAPAHPGQGGDHPSRVETVAANTGEERP